MPAKISKKGDLVLDLTGQKGTLCDRALKVLSHSNAEVVITLFEGEQLQGLIRGIGQYTILLSGHQGDILVFKHAIKTITSSDQAQPGRWEKARQRIKDKAPVKAK